MRAQASYNPFQEPHHVSHHTSQQFLDQLVERQRHDADLPTGPLQFGHHARSGNTSHWRTALFPRSPLSKARSLAKGWPVRLQALQFDQSRDNLGLLLRRALFTERLHRALHQHTPNTVHGFMPILPMVWTRMGLAG